MADAIIAFDGKIKIWRFDKNVKINFSYYQNDIYCQYLKKNGHIFAQKPINQ